MKLPAIALVLLLAGALSQYFGVTFLILGAIFVVFLVFGLKAMTKSEQQRRT